jgi:thiol-disulfide isomerase/thioredoxin
MSRPIYTLNSNDFFIENTNLIANIGGLSLVLFWSTRCKICPVALPEFKKLAGMQNQVNIATCCIDGPNSSIIQMSKNSTTEIKSVPKYLLYNDGMPLAEYTGANNAVMIIDFLKQIIAKLNSQTAVVQERPLRTRQQEPQPMQQQAMPRPMPPQNRAPVGPPMPNNPSGKPAYEMSSTGVKIYETSYGRPYNTTNEAEFLEYEAAYKK